MGRIIGIDLGTTNSVAAYWSKHRPKPIFNVRYQSPITPSVVAMEKGQRIVGQDAKDRRLSGSTDIIYSIKRFIGREFDDPKTQQALANITYTVRKAANGEVEVKLRDRYFSAVEISAMILEQLKVDAEAELGEEVTHAVITVPAYFGQRQKNATREAGKLAGLNVLRIINEPTAAALSFGLEDASSNAQYIVVFDYGGGTFDLSILMVAGGNFEVLNIDGDTFLGGDDIDALIVERMLDQINRESGADFSKDEVVKSQLKSHAEQLKISLSREEEAREVAAGLAKTQRNTPVNLDFSLKRIEFEQMISDMVEKSIQITLRSLKDAGLGVDEISRVLLVGGTTRIPLVRKRLKGIFGNKIEIDVDPMHCVGLGAAVQSAVPIAWMCSACNTVNEGSDDTCNSCHAKREEAIDIPSVACDSCGKNNRQGTILCWNCGARIGAVIEFAEGDSVEKDLNPEAQAIRIGDITSKFLGVGVESQSSEKEQQALKIIIPKGTLYPTDESYKHELFTNHPGQTQAQLPIFEVEKEEAVEEEWVLIGTVVNDKIPPGLPTNTPVTVEMHIDGDGILTVSSYLKKSRAETYVQKSFNFGGKGADQAIEEKLEDLRFWSTFPHILMQDSSLRNRLDQNQIPKNDYLAKQSDIILTRKDTQKAEPLVEEIKEYIKGLPAPIWELIWANFFMAQPQTALKERREMEQTIQAMENSANRRDFVVANQYLEKLREELDVQSKKTPTNLLRYARG